MNDDGFLGDKVEHIQKLANEVADLKGVVQDISQQIRRIERRINLVLPEKRREKPSKALADRSSPSVGELAMSEVQACQTIDRLTANLRDKRSIQSVQSELRNMNVKRELTPIAREFGMTNTALPPKTELVMNIITRMRQTVMLTENIRKMPRVAEEEKHFGK